MSWMQTYMGTRFDLTAPSVEQVSLRDIAWALSNQCRFNGHTRAFYSVAQHSVLVCDCVVDCLVEDEERALVKLLALLHDAAEAYVGDLTRPMKELVPGFAEIEQRVNAIVEAYFLRSIDPSHSGWTAKHRALVKLADRRVLAAEVQHVLPMGEVQAYFTREIAYPLYAIVPWTQQEAFTSYFAYVSSTLRDLGVRVCL